MEVNFTPDDQRPPVPGDQPSVGVRNFAIPGCYVVVANKDGEPIAMGEFLAIAFQMAASNPNSKVEFWIKVTE